MVEVHGDTMVVSQQDLVVPLSAWFALCMCKVGINGIAVAQHCGTSKIKSKNIVTDHYCHPVYGGVITFCTRRLSYKKRRFKRPKVWDVSNVFSEYGMFRKLWKDISNVPNVPNFGTFETSFLIGEQQGKLVTITGIHMHSTDNYRAWNFQP